MHVHDILIIVKVHARYSLGYLGTPYQLTLTRLAHMQYIEYRDFLILGMRNL